MMLADAIDISAAAALALVALSLTRLHAGRLARIEYLLGQILAELRRPRQ